MRRRLLACLLACLLVCLLGWSTLAGAATSKQYVNPETAVTFADSAQTPTVTFTLSALGSGAGQYSARYDKGSGAKAARWQLGCHVQLTGSNTAGNIIEIYVVRWDLAGSNSDGNLGTTTASLTSDKRRNLQLVGLLIVDQGTTNTTMAANFENVYIPGRYFSLAMWNGTVLPLKTDTAVHGCYAVPMPPENQ